MKSISTTQTPSITHRDSAAFRTYLSDVSRHRLISPDDEVELAIRIRQGDRAALDALVEANLRFAISVAKRYQGLGLPLEDLVAEANIGLIKAAERFDHTMGFRFISYAVNWVRQSVMDALAKKARTVRIPANQIETMLKLHKAVGVLEQELERAPQDDELAAYMDVTMAAVRKARNAEQKVAALDKPFGEDGESTLIDVIPNEQAPRPEAGLERQDLSAALKAALGQLMVRESEVLKLAFGLDGGEPRPIKEIAERFEVSPERIRQIRDRGLGSLRRLMPANALQVYLN